MAIEDWRGLACNCLRKALQIQAFNNSPASVSDKHALLRCKKSAARALQMVSKI
jgi:hypothetical protein